MKTTSNKNEVIAYLRKALDHNTKELGDKLADTIAKALDNKKVTVKTLNELAQEVAMTLVIGGGTTPMVENEIKKPKKLGKAKAKDEVEELTTDAEVTEEVAEETPAPTEEPVAEEKKVSKIKKGAPKSKATSTKEDAETTKVAPPKAKGTKEPLVKVAQSNAKSIPTVSFMPKEFKSELGTLRLNTEINSVKDFAQAVEDGKDLVLAVYWSKRLLKQFSYDPTNMGTPVSSFPDDLDLQKPVYVSDNGKTITCISVYTEVLGLYFNDELKFDEESGLRFANGAEFNIYEVVSE